MEQKEAEWIEESDRVNHWHCSSCGFVEGWRCTIEKYCPMCGAKMRGKQKVENVPIKLENKTFFR